MNLPLSILVVGDCSPPEFSAAVEWLIAHGAAFVDTIATALDEIRDGFAPALIFLAEQVPGQFSAGEVARLRSAAPLARFTALLGSWLEGESRSGKPWPAVIRSYWHQWPARIVRQLENWTGAEFTDWALPITAGDDERLLAAAASYPMADQRDEPIDGSEAPAELSDRPLIAIYACRRDTWDSLDTACRSFGYRTIWNRQACDYLTVNSDLILFDLVQISNAELNCLAACKTAKLETPLIALAGFPRPNDFERLKHAGASAIISKPFLNDDLNWQIEQLLQSGLAIRFDP